MASVQQRVDAKIAGKKVMVFSKTYCPYCTMAKTAFKDLLGKELSVNDYEVMEIENDPDCSAIQDYLQQLTGARSVPRVFIKGKFIGGGSEISEMHKNGKLKSIL